MSQQTTMLLIRTTRDMRYTSDHPHGSGAGGLSVCLFVCLSACLRLCPPATASPCDSDILVRKVLVPVVVPTAEQAMGRWVSGSNGSLFRMGHMCHGSVHVDP